MENNAYISQLNVRNMRLVQAKNGRLVKHTIDPKLNNKFSKPFYFTQNLKGKIKTVFFPHDEVADVIGLKKGMIFSLSCETPHVF